MGNNFSFDFSGVQKQSSVRGLTDPIPEPEQPTVPVEVMLDTMFDIFMARFDILEQKFEELKDGS